METGKSLAGEKARSVVPTLAVTGCVGRVLVAVGVRGGGGSKQGGNHAQSAVNQPCCAMCVSHQGVSFIRVVCHRSSVIRGCLLSGWFVISRLLSLCVFYQGGSSSVVYYQGGLNFTRMVFSSGWFLIRVISVSSGWSFVRVISHKDDLFFRVVFRQGGLLSGWFLVRVVSVSSVVFC